MGLLGVVLFVVGGLGKVSGEILPCGAEQELGQESIGIQSVGWGKSEGYPNSHLCTWNLLFPGRSALLSCNHFELTEFLCLDHLLVGDGNAVQNHYCGKRGPSNLVLRNKANIRFSTSAFFPGVGFTCRLTPLESEVTAEDDDPAIPEGKLDCACGINNLGTKVVNGTETKMGEVPWQAGLVRMGDSVPFCGGSLISNRYILTAAHCILGRTPYNLEVLLNADRQVVNVEGTVPDRHTVSTIIPHPKYTSSLDYDAALVKLGEDVDLALTAPICLPYNRSEQFAGVGGTVTGWGYTMEDGELSAVLRKGGVTVMGNEECRGKYARITERMLCAAAPGTDACQGDSGGPLFYESDAKLRKHLQIGIVSWGIGCARPNRPGVYTRITEITKWIQKSIKDSETCKN